MGDPASYGAGSGPGSAGLPVSNDGRGGDSGRTRQMIKALEDAFEFSTSKSLIIWMEKLMNLRLNSKDECEEHTDALLHVFSKLEMGNMELSDSQKTAYLFGSLGSILVPSKAL
ncbi:hypothetical protein JRQ81_007573 [Phrynocephalus forsythii]|uniref:Uncharacterized protein n=1 Tax=Phrynocephalus forsythii TaxID=171643 RepID=A0A9Q0Y4M8_9SAUR|nr:hypothetical protein JRQ81_007573 [Phrynocephalus forsythii]